MASNISQLPLERRLGNMTKKGAGRSNNIIPFPNASAEHGGDEGHGGGHGGHADPIHDAEVTYNSAKRVLDTTQLAHDEAFLYAAKLIRDKKGEVDTSRLEDEGMRDKFVKRMLQFYVRRARKSFAADEQEDHGEHAEDEAEGEDIDPIKADRMLQAYMGMTGTILKKQISQYGAKYSKEVHDGLMNRVHQQMQQQFDESITSNIKHENIEDVIQYTHVDPHQIKRPLELDEAKDLLRTKFHGDVSESYLKRNSWYGAPKHGEEGSAHNVVRMSDYKKPAHAHLKKTG